MQKKIDHELQLMGDVNELVAAVKAENEKDT